VFQAPKFSLVLNRSFGGLISKPFSCICCEFRFTWNFFN